MRRTSFELGLIVSVVAAAVLLGPVAAGDKNGEGFVKLFNGKDFTGWVKVGADKTDPWSIQDGVIVCTGKPNGYLRTEKNYRNYVLRYDWMYKRPANLKDEKSFGGNSGCLVHIQLPDKVWPKCVEVQGMNREHAKIFALGGAKGKYSDDDGARWKALRPVGEWNTTEIISKDGMLTSKINGVQIATGSGTLTEGPIGFQSEGAEIHFRNFLIRETK
jgi:hypothetical protein